MPIDVAEPQSPGWWLDRLIKRLGEKRPGYDLLDSYYDCRHAIPVHADRAIGDAYRRLMRIARTNYAELVVEAVRERMLPVGFRTGAAGDALGDREAWAIWQANSLDADSALVHAPSLSMGMSYVIVGPGEEPGVPAVITPEDPREVIVETDPRHRRKVLAGLKVFRDDVDGVERAYVYLPGEVWRAVRPSSWSTSMGAAPAHIEADAGGWEWDGAPDTYEGDPPVVPFPNRPKTGQQVTRGEFETHLPLLDRIDYTVLNALEIATLQAFRQRALKGGPSTDGDGNAIDYDDIFESRPGAIWHLPDGADLWESGQVDLNGIRQQVRDFVQDLAAVTRTPLFYLSSDAANGSAEGASLARESLVFKTRDRLTETGEAWERVMALAFRFMGDDARADQTAMEIIWSPPEHVSFSEKADAAAKAIAGGMTWRAVMETVWQMTPQQIETMEEERAAEAVQAAGAALVGEVIGGSRANGVAAVS